ncbi:MAG: NAD(P)H-dependent oxidoreductase [Calditrichaeota bacterium]|nr:MAG: NAD(P)H-dependent oxidoreductase [Calditrichota bacterium]
MSKRGQIKIVAIGGSVRPANYTSRALNVVVEEFNEHHDVTVAVVAQDRVAALPLPGIGGNHHGARELQELVAAATGVVLATPEYHGSYSSAMKLVVENLGFPSVLSGKPVALLGVASGQIGAIKALEHLRSVCSHVGAIVLPGPVSVANVNKVFDDQGRCQDARIERRLRGLATNLLDYIKASICPRAALEEFVRNP